MLSTYIKSIFIDHKHSHVFRQQLAWVSCNDKKQTKDQTPWFKELIYYNTLKCTKSPLSYFNIVIYSRVSDIL